MTPKDGRSSACSNFHIVFFFQPLSNIKALDQNEEWVSHWTNTAQQLVVSMKNTTSVEVINVKIESPNNRNQYNILSQKCNPCVLLWHSELFCFIIYNVVNL